MSSHYDINVVKIQDEQNTAYLIDFSPVLKPLSHEKRPLLIGHFFRGESPSMRSSMYQTEHDGMGLFFMAQFRFWGSSK